MRKCGPRVGTRARENAEGIAEPISKRIEVVDAHHERRERSLLRAQGIQCGMARISIVASTGSPRSPRSINALRARIEWSYRMFWLTCNRIRAFAGLDERLSSAELHRQRLLGEDASHVSGTLGDPADDVRLPRGGTAISTISISGSSSIASRLSKRVDASKLRHFFRRRAGARSGRPPGSPPVVRDQMAIPDDKPGAHDADPHVATLGSLRQVSEAERIDSASLSSVE